MNSSIKRRQTLFINWLAKTLNCKPITRAESGSYYTEFNTQYTGKSVIRISDHLSSDRTYIHIILSPINTNVIVNYKNFIWTGDYTTSKQIVYTLIMSKAMTELCNPTPSNTTPVKKESKKKEKIKSTYKISSGMINSLGKKIGEEFRQLWENSPECHEKLYDFLKTHCSSSQEQRIIDWTYLKQKI